MHEQWTGKLDISHLPGPDLVKEAASKGVQQVVEHIQGVHIRILQADPNLPKGHIVLSLSRTINKERLTWTQLQASASPELLIKRWDGVRAAAAAAEDSIDSTSVASSCFIGQSEACPDNTGCSY